MSSHDHPYFYSLHFSTSHHQLNQDSDWSPRLHFLASSAGTPTLQIIMFADKFLADPQWEAMLCFTGRCQAQFGNRIAIISSTGSIGIRLLLTELNQICNPTSLADKDLSLKRPESLRFASSTAVYVVLLLVQMLAYMLSCGLVGFEPHVPRHESLNDLLLLGSNWLQWLLVRPTPPARNLLASWETTARDLPITLLSFGWWAKPGLGCSGHGHHGLFLLIKFQVSLLGRSGQQPRFLLLVKMPSSSNRSIPSFCPKGLWNHGPGLSWWFGLYIILETEPQNDVWGCALDLPLICASLELLWFIG